MAAPTHRPLGFFVRRPANEVRLVEFDLIVQDFSACIWSCAFPSIRVPLFDVSAACDENGRYRQLKTFSGALRLPIAFLLAPGTTAMKIDIWFNCWPFFSNTNRNLLLNRVSQLLASLHSRFTSIGCRIQVIYVSCFELDLEFQIWRASHSTTAVQSTTWSHFRRNFSWRCYPLCAEADSNLSNCSSSVEVASHTTIAGGCNGSGSALLGSQVSRVGGRPETDSR